MTLDTTQILILALILVLVLDAIGDKIGDKILVWKLVNILAGGNRAPTFPPVPVGPLPAPLPVPGPVPEPPVPVPVPEPPKPVPAPAPAPVPSPAAGPVHKWVGKCSEFGGPHDTGSGDPSEGLALVGAVDIPNFQDVLLPGAHGDALFRQLNPDAFYIACRFDYSETPKSYLKTLHIPVRNPANGTSAVARAVDWGPNAKTGRVADLSPGLMAKLGLQTDGIVEVDIPLPAGGPAQPASPVAGGTVLQHNTWPTQADAASFYGSPHSTADHVEVPCPWVLNGGKTKSITIHRLCAASLARVLAYIWEQCGKSQAQIHAFGYDVFDGSYVDRVIAGTNTESMHGYACALDFNAAANPQHAPLSQTKFKSDSLIVFAFKAEDWVWGGDWSPASIDAMHFQAARVR